jgi:hypothetical protein
MFLFLETEVQICATLLKKYRVGFLQTREEKIGVDRVKQKSKEETKSWMEVGR